MAVCLKKDVCKVLGIVFACLTDSQIQTNIIFMKFVIFISFGTFIIYPSLHLLDTCNNHSNHVDIKLPVNNVLFGPHYRSVSDIANSQVILNKKFDTQKTTSVQLD